MRTITISAGQRLTSGDLHRAGALPRNVMDAAEAIVDDVRARGDEAVREYCLRFDGACPTSFRVPDEVIAGALRAYDEGVKGKSFPGADNSVHIEENLISKAEDYLDGLFDAFFDDDSAIDN